MDPVLVAAALGDGSDADVLLEGGGIGVAIALFAERSQEPRREDRPRARQFGKEDKIAAASGLDTTWPCHAYISAIYTVSGWFSG
jgi:hypothetical protein